MPPYTEINLTSPDNGWFGSQITGAPYNRYNQGLDTVVGLNSGNDKGLGNYVKTSDGKHWLSFITRVTNGFDGAGLPGNGSWDGVGYYESVQHVISFCLDVSGTSWTSYDITSSNFGERNYFLGVQPSTVWSRYVTDGTNLWLGVLIPDGSLIAAPDYPVGRIADSNWKYKLKIYHFNGTSWDSIGVISGAVPYTGSLNPENLVVCASSNDSGVAYFSFAEKSISFNSYNHLWITKVNTSGIVWSVDVSAFSPTADFDIANDTGTCIIFETQPSTFGSPATTSHQYSIDSTTGAQTHLQDITHTGGTLSPIISNLLPDGVSYYVSLSQSTGGNYGTTNIYKIKADGSSQLLELSVSTPPRFLVATENSGVLRDLWIRASGLDFANENPNIVRYDNSCYHNWVTTTSLTHPPNWSDYWFAKTGSFFVDINHIWGVGSDYNVGSSLYSWGIARAKLKYTTCPSDPTPTRNFERCLGYFKDDAWHLVPELVSSPVVNTELYQYTNEAWVPAINPIGNKIGVFKNGAWHTPLEP